VKSWGKQPSRNPVAVGLDVTASAVVANGAVGANWSDVGVQD